MARDTTVQFRIDSTVKEEAFAVFQQMGISPSEAVRVFFKQVQKTRTLPFAVVAAEAKAPDVEDDSPTGYAPAWPTPSSSLTAAT
ncbi:antitoxin RelB [mine drainage metagenome]|uniref:Antitoxin RelB n=1 Tax=mine drainage metagenome TaxID=410659 RepID=A0A1J5NYJ7_9ZZZZ